MVAGFAFSALIAGLLRMPGISVSTGGFKPIFRDRAVLLSPSLIGATVGISLPFLEETGWK
jgi:hypothetical protein